MNCLGYEQIDLNTPAVKSVSDLTIPDGTTVAQIQAQDEGDINYVLDGSTPGGSRGMILQAGGSYVEVTRAWLQGFKFCQSAGDTKLNIQYFGRTI